MSDVDEKRCRQQEGDSVQDRLMRPLNSDLESGAQCVQRTAFECPDACHINAKPPE